MSDAPQSLIESIRQDQKRGDAGTTKALTLRAPAIDYQLATSGLDKEKASGFKNELVRVVSSESFLTQLSDKLGTPQEGETRSQFIERGKNILREMLRKIFQLQ